MQPPPLHAIHCTRQVGGHQAELPAAAMTEYREQVDVAIVGAGAAGLTAAIFAARVDPHLSVLLLDATPRPGAKILISGGGRCNVTNARVGPGDYLGGNPHLLRRVLAAFPVSRTIEWFRGLGVPLHEEDDGRLFPDTNRARTVLDALLGEARRRRIRLRTACRITSIQIDRGTFELRGDGATIRARRVVLATGGMSLPRTGSDGSGYDLARSVGHTVVPPTPALVPLVLNGCFHRRLSGVSHRAEIAVRAEGDRPIRMEGPMLWTHFGLSGPVVLNVSRFWHRAAMNGRRVSVTLSFLPGQDFAGAEQRLINMHTSHARVRLRNALTGLVPSRVGQAILEQLGIDSDTAMSRLSREDRRRLARALVEWPLEIRGSRGFTHAEVTAGGVPLSEVDPATMGSRRCPGMYLAGEILDVDGPIGGFNFQWAWSSGYVAGTAAARAAGPGARSLRDGHEED